jgi:hypothetical protein
LITAAVKTTWAMAFALQITGNLLPAARPTSFVVAEHDNQGGFRQDNLRCPATIKNDPRRQLEMTPDDN